MHFEEITLMYKIKLLPSEERKKEIDKTLSLILNALNYISSEIFKTKELNRIELHHLYYYKLREKFNLKSQLAENVLSQAVVPYKTLKGNKHNWTLIRFKKADYTLQFNRDYTFMKNGTISLNTSEDRTKVNFVDKNNLVNDKENKLGTATLIKRKGKYFLCVPVTRSIEVSDFEEIKNVVGVDLGINFLAATYASNHKTTFYKGRYIKAKREHYKKLRKELQKKGTKSAKRRLKSISNRENRWINDVNHVLSKSLVEKECRETLFVLEDLKGVRKSLKEITKSNRSLISSWAFYDLSQKIIYKAKKKGQLVIKVNPKNTSLTCPICGHVEKGNRNKTIHLFTCKNCGYNSNDDRIGAMNLYRKGIEYIENKLSKDIDVDKHDLSTQDLSQ